METKDSTKPKKSSAKGAHMRRQVGRIIAQKLKKGEEIYIQPIMRQVGYSDTYSNSQGIRKVRNSPEVKEEIARFTSKLDLIIDLSLDNATEKASTATFRDSILAIQTLTKTKQETEMLQGVNPSTYFTDDSRVILERITERIKIKGDATP